jgi:hypothetical protein
MKKVFAKTWDGTNWTPRGPTATPLSQAEAVSPSAALDVHLGPVVSWVEPKAGYFVKQFSDGGWVPVGGSLNTFVSTTDLRYGPSLATDADHDNLAVAWSMSAALHVMRHNR